jgi:hypothetical protein
LPSINKKTFTVGKGKHKFDVSESCYFEGNKKEKKDPDVSHSDKTFENISTKMVSEGIKSKVISADIGREITRFENANCFGMKPMHLTYEERERERMKLQEFEKKK